jgi:hypothetical protein
VAERQLPKLNVAGSIPVSRSNKINGLHTCSLCALFMIITKLIWRPQRLRSALLLALAWIVFHIALSAFILPANSPSTV